jgi:hypothetical protein
MGESNATRAADQPSNGRCFLALAPPAWCFESLTKIEQETKAVAHYSLNQSSTCPRLLEEGSPNTLLLDHAAHRLNSRVSRCADCRADAIGNHAIVKFPDRRRPGANAQKRKYRMRKTGEPTENHASGKTARGAQMLKVGLPNRSRVFCKREPYH